MQNLKEQLVNVIHFLHTKGWAPATSSNYSFREPGESNFYISESGIDKGEFHIENFIYVNKNGQPIDDPRKPSAETAVHCIIYQLFSDIHCVCIHIRF